MKTQKGILVLLGKILLVGIPLVGLWLFAAFGKMYYLDGEAPNYLWLRKQLNTAHDGVEVVFIGDSAMNSAIDPSLMTDVNALCLANGGGCPYDGYYMLKEYLEHNPTPKVVYYGYEYEHLEGTGSLWDRVLYTHLISYKDAMEMMHTMEDRRHEWAFSGRPNAFRQVRSYYINYPGVYLPAMINAGFVGRHAANVEQWNTIEAHKGHYMAITDDINPDYNEYMVYDFVVADICDYYMRKTLDLCDSYGITVRMIGIPTCPNTQFDVAYQDAQLAYMEDLASNHPKVSYLPPTDTVEHDHFLDGHHLNNAGCAFFTNFLMETYPEDFHKE